MEQNSTSSETSMSSGVPFNNTSHNYDAAEAGHKPAAIKIPDGRRNSMGEKLPSPVETWKPNFARRQSWKMEDLKREHLMTELTKKKGEDVGAGFTEVQRTT
jgi:hypothetical protein